MTQIVANLPRDADAQPIQVLGADESGVVKLTTSAAAQLIAIDSDAEVVEVSSTEDVHIEFGGSGVVATTTDSRVFPRGSAVYRLLEGQTHLSVINIASGANGQFSVGRLK